MLDSRNAFWEYRKVGVIHGEHEDVATIYGMLDHWFDTDDLEN